LAFPAAWRNFSNVSAPAGARAFRELHLELSCWFKNKTKLNPPKISPRCLRAWVLVAGQKSQENVGRSGLVFCDGIGLARIHRTGDVASWCAGYHPFYPSHQTVVKNAASVVFADGGSFRD
jgi:hypothetical protein